MNPATNFRNVPAPRRQWRQALVVARRLGLRPLMNRSGLLLICCVLFASSIAATLGLFTASVQRALDKDVARFLGAPLVVRSSRPLPEAWWQATRHVQRARTATFTTGAIGPRAYHGISLKAVSDGYPVSGQLMLASGNDSSEAARGIPPTGSAWLDRRAMDELGADLGDSIQVGRARLTVRGTIVMEPDRLTQFQHMLPRVMIALDDLAATGIDQSSGRGEFRYLFAAEPGLLEPLERRLDDLDDPHEVLKPARGSHPFARISERAGRFLGLVGVLVFILCGSAAAILAGHIVRRYRMPSAVLRCFGAGSRVIHLALVAYLSLMAFAVAGIGGLLGALLQRLLIHSLQPHLQDVSPGFAAGPILSALAIGVTMTSAFVLPRLNATGKMPVSAALRGTPPESPSLWPTVLGAVICAALMVWYYSDNWQLTAMLCLGVAGIVVITAGLGWLM
ncbi:MAG: ABC transporter permease, partial [Wenzhouxiangellaceae bacterium]